MLPIAAEIASRMNKEQAGSALPHAPTVDVVENRRQLAAKRPRRTLATALRRVAATSHGLADRVERPVATE